MVPLTLLALITEPGESIISTTIDFIDNYAITVTTNTLYYYHHSLIVNYAF